MKKLFCLFTAIFLVLLLSVTVSAEGFDASMSVRDINSNRVWIDVFFVTKTPVYGGEFTLSIDEKYAVCSDINSEIFDVEACENKSQVEIAVAGDECVKLSDEEPAFCVELKLLSKDHFDVQLKTEYIISDNFDRIQPENNITKLTVDNNSLVESSLHDKGRSVRSIEKEKSKITEKSKDITDSDNRLLPIRIDGKSFGYGLLLAIGALVVVTFLFGLFFRKYSSDKEEK